MNLKRHELTREDRVKGGRANTEVKRIANSIKNRKICSTNCPIYPCAVQRQTTELGGKCAFKELPKDVQKSCLNILKGGHEGIITEFTKLIQEILALSNRGTANVAEKRRLLADLREYIKTVYGDKQKLTVEEPVEIIVKWKD